ncbi:aminotransferase class III-fold pyridoxal phosphate-dependent enzyme [Enorma phocaeensis]|uniref:aminotransferase class III-fold pyridoxal phosphate-dependent enzyme n=1 Tax=Enorma phocaeensis TaxID=1871019 RepID=UPI0032080DF8
MDLEQERSLDGTYIMPTFGRLPVLFTHGEGMRLYDDTGKEYLDFLAGIGVCCLGHGHPALVNALSHQAEQLLHVSNYYYIEHRAEVAALLSKLANNDMEGAERLARALRSGDAQAAMDAAQPAAGEQVWQTFFANSGAEANECSLKLARLYAQRHGNGGNAIVCLHGGFHGRTLETLAATMQERLQEPFQPLPGGFLMCEPNDIDGLRELFAQHGKQIAGILIEPIQGESGVHPLTAEFVHEAAELAHAAGALLISDEVQAGMFRCGAPFAIQSLGITPDIMSLAKGIAGGVPCGACVARAEIARTFAPGEHGTTFGGSNLAAAAAEAVLCELICGAYGEHAVHAGTYLMERLDALPCVTEVRGRGLMVGCDLAPDACHAHDLVAALLDDGFVLNATGDHTLRFLPPLICTPDDIDLLVDALAHRLEQAG